MLKLLKLNNLTEGCLATKPWKTLPLVLKLLAAIANQVYTQTQKLDVSEHLWFLKLNIAAYCC